MDFLDMVTAGLNRASREAEKMEARTMTKQERKVLENEYDALEALNTLTPKEITRMSEIANLLDEEDDPSNPERAIHDNETDYWEGE